MIFIKSLFCLCFLGSLSGCAGVLGFIADPAISSDHLDEANEPNKLKGLKGDRRLIRTHRKDSDVYEICAETQADAISSRSPKASLSQEAKFAYTDEVLEALTKTVERSSISDVVRQLEWNLCNARMNNYIDNDEFYAELIAIRAGAFEALRPVAPSK